MLIIRYELVAKQLIDNKMSALILNKRIEPTYNTTQHFIL